MGRLGEWPTGAREVANNQLPISDFRLPIEHLGRFSIGNRQSTIGNLTCSTSGFSSTCSLSACWCWTSGSFTVAGALCARARPWLGAPCGSASPRPLPYLVFFWQGRQVATRIRHRLRTRTLLSVDNLFLFLVIFRYFAVPEPYQHRVLFWGILGALLMRGSFILPASV